MGEEKERKDLLLNVFMFHVPFFQSDSFYVKPVVPSRFVDSSSLLFPPHPHPNHHRHHQQHGHHHGHGFRSLSNENGNNATTNGLVRKTGNFQSLFSLSIFASLLPVLRRRRRIPSPVVQHRRRVHKGPAQEEAFQERGSHH